MINTTPIQPILDDEINTISISVASIIPLYFTRPLFLIHNINQIKQPISIKVAKKEGSKDNPFILANLYSIHHCLTRGVFSPIKKGRSN